ncbi:YdcF family protein [Gordonia sp. NPDC003504]
MTQVRRRYRRLAIGAVAVASLGGVVVATQPTDDGGLRPVAVSVDPSSLYNSAQQRFAAGDVAGGLTELRQVLTLSPGDGQSLALQAIWADQIDDADTGRTALDRLTVVNPLLVATARRVIAGVTDAAAIVPSTEPTATSGNPAIVILGFGLSPQGTMAPELIKRLAAGKLQAQADPTAPIVVTGGKPQNGVTEAAAMRTWLVDNGIDASRIVTEDRSVSTMSNAQNSATILAARGINSVVLVTSPNHIRRAAADFAAAGLSVTGAVTTPTDLTKYATPLSKDKQTGIRVEATRAAGLPASRQPLLPSDQLPDVGPGLIGDIGGKILEQLGVSGSAG